MCSKFANEEGRCGRSGARDSEDFPIELTIARLETLRDNVQWYETSDEAIITGDEVDAKYIIHAKLRDSVRYRKNRTGDSGILLRRIEFGDGKSSLPGGLQLDPYYWSTCPSCRVPFRPGTNLCANNGCGAWIANVVNHFVRVFILDHLVSEDKIMQTSRLTAREAEVRHGRTAIMSRPWLYRLILMRSNPTRGRRATKDLKGILIAMIVMRSAKPIATITGSGTTSMRC